MKIVTFEVGDEKRKYELTEALIDINNSGEIKFSGTGRLLPAIGTETTTGTTDIPNWNFTLPINISAPVKPKRMSRKKIVNKIRECIIKWDTISSYGSSELKLDLEFLCKRIAPERGE